MILFAILLIFFIFQIKQPEYLLSIQLEITKENLSEKSNFRS